MKHLIRKIISTLYVLEVREKERIYKSIQGSILHELLAIKLA